MDLYFLRHGKAERATPDGADATRPLTPKGRKECRRVARWMRNHGLAFDLIATSPYVRARETTALVLEALAPPRPAEVWNELRPTGDTATVFDRLTLKVPGMTILLVGHDPLLSALVGSSIGGGKVRLAKGALAKVGGWSPEQPGDLEWLITPALLTQKR
jgi:phosphohistidine phosphatase